MLPEERDRHVIRTLVRVAPLMMGLTGGVFLYTVWSGVLLTWTSLAYPTGAIGGGALWVSYRSWQVGRVRAYVVPVLLVGLVAVKCAREGATISLYALQEVSFAVFVYFFLLRLVASRLRKQDDLPRLVEVNTAQPINHKLSSEDKTLIGWLVALAPLCVILATGGLWYTVQQGGRLSQSSAIWTSVSAAVMVGGSYLWWKTWPGHLSWLPPAMFLGQSLAYIIPFGESPLGVLHQLQRFSLKVFVFFLLLWCLKSHLRRQGWLA
jgi:hypothetical protein